MRAIDTAMTNTRSRDNVDIGHEQVRLLFTQAINVVYGGIATVAVEAAILWSATEHFWLLLWVACSALISIVRLTFYQLYKRRQPADRDLHKWLRVYLVIIFFVGLIWGGSGFLMLVTPSYLHQTLIIITLGGVSLVAISAHGSSVKAYSTFILPALLPLAVWQFTYENAVHSGFGINILLFTIVLYAAARNYNKAILASLRLRRENLELAEKAESASKAKSAFLANMSHEIRTPLTAILGYAESALDADQTEIERVMALKAVKRSGDHLLQIINNVLDFSKIEADKLEAEKVRVDYFAVLSEVEALVSRQANSKGLDFRLIYTFPLPASFMGDPVRLRQVLLNLCSNAIKFTESGKVLVSVSYNPEHRWLCFSVEDTGIGMAKDQVDRIFTPFEQADSSITRRFGGTGLGLALSKRLVELMGGTLNVISTPNVGTTFELTLPCANPAGVPMVSGITDVDTEQLGSQLVVPAVRHSLRGRVLLAEDNPENQKLLSLILEKMGAEVTVAENGQEAVDKAVNTHFDLVYMDMQMPLVSGIEATEILRSQDYRAPIIALTANATSEDRDQCLQAGCDDFLTKPINRDMLYEVTSRYLSEADSVTHEAAIFSQLHDDDPEIQALLLRFVHSLPETISECENIYQHQAWVELQQHMHDLKGTAGNFGYPLLSRLAEKIETALKQEHYQDLADLFTELVNQAARIARGATPAAHKQSLRSG